MHNSYKQSTSGNNNRYQPKKTHTIPSHKPNYKGKRDTDNQNDSYYNKKPLKSHQSQQQSGEFVGGKKISVSKRSKDQTVLYYIEYKNREILLGSSWKEVMEAVDRHFPQSDLMLNLAVKINLWEELRNYSYLNIPKQDIEEILILYGKYRDRSY